MKADEEENVAEKGSSEYIKRMAAQIVSQLPEDSQDAMSVLDYAREILVNLGKSWEEQEKTQSRDKPIRLVSRVCREEQ